MSWFVSCSARVSALAIVLSLVLFSGCDNSAPTASSPPPKAPPSNNIDRVSDLLSQSAVDQTNATEEPNEDSTSKDEPASKTKQADPPQATADVQLDIASWEETQAIIAEHKGKVVVLDLWSTNCIPCLKEFPHLVEIHEKYGTDVVCLALNCNYIGVGKPEDDKPVVLDFLTATKAHFRNLMSNEEDTELYKKVGIASIPVVQVYGRDGKLAKQFDNEKEEYGKDGFTYVDHIVPFVESLVKAEQ
jgi:thiol-disulfide isomerase/thioredoxin